MGIPPLAVIFSFLIFFSPIKFPYCQRCVSLLLSNPQLSAPPFQTRTKPPPLTFKSGFFFFFFRHGSFSRTVYPPPPICSNQSFSLLRVLSVFISFFNRSHFTISAPFLNHCLVPSGSRLFYTFNSFLANPKGFFPLLCAPSFHCFSIFLSLFPPPPLPAALGFNFFFQ